jgi:hypothetical protein
MATDAQSVAATLLGGDRKKAKLEYRLIGSGMAAFPMLH